MMITGPVDRNLHPPQGVEALRRLVTIAQSDTGQARRAANFILAWWNAENFGGFDFTDLWNVDNAIADDMMDATDLLRRAHSYPNQFVPREAIVAIIERWR